MHAVWNDVMTNPLVIPNYEHADDAEQPTTGANEYEQLQEDLRQENESQQLEA